MIVAEQMQGGVCRVKFELSRLDASVAEAVKSELKTAIDRGAKRLEIDFSGIQFMDSSGLGALVGALKMMGAGGQLEIVSPTPTVLKVLKLTRMNKVFIVREAP